jgi:hypothetical protein
VAGQRTCWISQSCSRRTCECFRHDVPTAPSRPRLELELSISSAITSGPLSLDARWTLDMIDGYRLSLNLHRHHRIDTQHCRRRTRSAAAACWEPCINLRPVRPARIRSRAALLWNILQGTYHTLVSTLGGAKRPSKTVSWLHRSRPAVWTCREKNCYLQVASNQLPISHKTALAIFRDIGEFRVRVGLPQKPLVRVGK